MRFIFISGVCLSVFLPVYLSDFVLVFGPRVRSSRACVMSVRVGSVSA